MTADGSGQTRLTRGNAFQSAPPAWSPDGRRIAFASERDGNAEIYVVNADGTGQRNLTRDPGYEGDPAWSPDGRKIAFTSGSRSCAFSLASIRPKS
jgi:TolB protein